ncbi:MAG: hypothetical protein ACI4OX_04540, partial [Akkermansia sp.]
MSAVNVNCIFMKKKLFLVLCSCFAGALALSSCGGGGGMDADLSPSELLRYFVNGAFEIRYYGNPNSISVTGQGGYDPSTNTGQTLTVVGVPVICRSLMTTNTSMSCYAEYTINLDATGVPQTMVVKFSSVSANDGNDGTMLLPVGKEVTVTMTPDDAMHPFQVNTRGKADFDPGAAEGDAS